jgi:capsular exopolysaccharide synthesis family protein
MSDIIDFYYSTSATVRESIKTLRTNIQFADIDNEIKTLMVTSTAAGEGKTTTSIFLAIAMAEGGKRTVIVETDCRKPMIANRLGQRNQYNWLDFISGKVTLTEAIAPTDQPNLYFLDTELHLANPVELIGSSRFLHLIDQLRNEFDIVIFDTPPLGYFIEAALLASRVDGTIITIRSGKVDNKKAQDVLEQLKRANARVLGVVLNEVASIDENDYYYKYYDHDKSGKEKTKSKKVKKRQKEYSRRVKWGD